MTENNKAIEALEKENIQLKDKLAMAGFRIAELKTQIEDQKSYIKAVDDEKAKMKCCENCKSRFIRSIPSFIDDDNEEPCKSCISLSNWQLQ